MGPTPDWPTQDLLAHRARSTPDATAVVAADDGRAWRYADLDRAVDAAAGELDAALDGTRSTRGGGGRPGVVLTARTDRRFVAALFAAWRVGARVVPVAADAPVADLADRVERLDPELVVAADPASAPWPDGGWPVRSLDAVVQESDIDRESATDGSATDGSATDGSIPDRPATNGPVPDRSVPDAGSDPDPWSPDETALVLFTSGTTGAPKGVRLTHGNLVASATASAFRLGLDPDDCWLDCLPTNHMGGLAPIVRSVCYGTTVVLQPGFDATATADAMASHGATAVSLVPTQLRRLLDGGWTPPESLRFVLLGGAPAGRDLLAASEDAGVPVCPTYGTTETASQIATVEPGAAVVDPDAADHRGTVGSPLVVADVTIVDRAEGIPVEPGEVGEVVVDGPIVSPGYLDDAATRDAFGEFGLHTGDLASRDEFGRLRIHGRVDDAIQTGGETVHPWRVADVLADHPAVAEAAVVGLPDPEWGERVAAVVVPDGDRSVAELSADRTELEAHARDGLAPFEVPKSIRVVDALPRTESGTVDREAVRDRLRE